MRIELEASSMPTAEIRILDQNSNQLKELTTITRKVTNNSKDERDSDRRSAMERRDQY